MVKRNVLVTQMIEVEVDETNFDQKFIDEFSRYFYTLDFNGHIKNLAELHAQGVCHGSGCFVEGYGKLSEMGVSMKSLWIGSSYAAE